MTFRILQQTMVLETLRPICELIKLDEIITKLLHICGRRAHADRDYPWEIIDIPV
jgi:hypothetical protein